MQKKQIKEGAGLSSFLNKKIGKAADNWKRVFGQNPSRPSTRTLPHRPANNSLAPSSSAPAGGVFDPRRGCH
jgi:hypothetical protein